MDTLWKDLCRCLEKPDSDSKHFMLPGIVERQDALLPELRKLLAFYKRLKRRDKLMLESRQLHHQRVYRHNSTWLMQRECLVNRRLKRKLQINPKDYNPLLRPMAVSMFYWAANP